MNNSLIINILIHYTVRIFKNSMITIVLPNRDLSETGSKI